MIHRSFYFLRHGETDWNVAERLQGHTDVPLNENGRMQARAAIPVLLSMPVDRIVASPLMRAYETATIINAILQKPLTTDARLKEKCFGIFEGMTPPEVAQWKADRDMSSYEVEESTGYHLVPGYERYADLQARILEAKNEALSQFPNDNILFVAHGAIYRVLCRAFFGETDFSPNAQPFHFHREAPMVWKLATLK